MQPLLRRFQSDPAFASVLAALDEPGTSAHAEGIVAQARPLFIAALHLATRRPTLVLCPTEELADKLHQSLAPCLPEGRARFLPSVEMTLYERYSIDTEAAADRLRVLGELVTGQGGLLVTSASSLLHDIMPRRRFAELTRPVRSGADLDRDEVLRWLVSAGYRRAEMVTDPGEFAARGCIIDVYPPTLGEPIRVELFGDTVDSIRSFDPGTQRSRSQLGHVRLVPANETVPSDAERSRAAARLEELHEEQRAHLAKDARERLAEHVREDAEALRQGRFTDAINYYHQLLFEERETLLDYVPRDTLVVVYEPHRIERACEELLGDLAEAHARRVERGELLQLPEPVFRGSAELEAELAARQCVYLTLLAPSLPWVERKRLVDFGHASVDSMRGSVAELCGQVSDWQLGGNAVLLSTTQAKRLKSILAEHAVEHVEEYAERADLASGMAHVGSIPIAGGFRAPGCGLVVVTDREMFGYHRPVLPPRRPRAEVKLTTLAELREGDYVVHVAHGIGRYVAIVQDTVEGVERDYLQIEYEGGVLKVPTTQIDRVQRYIGAEGAAPKLDNLAGTTWKRKRKRAEEATRRLAIDLLKLYARREAASGFRFSEDQPWQREMESAFVYDETRDQLEAIDATKDDMMSDKPMDRLVCGDVGFGKTEVAVRAAFKSVLDGRQVAVLVPTTILCEQHYRTFEERLGAYPVRIDKLSRFSTRAESRRTLDGLKSGAADIVIGTHRLLSDRVAFANLGLIIVDEEHRFGVGHKETLKLNRPDVDLLTLTATPIPRTLHMALSGIRDLSTIQEAPRGRVAIRTFCVQDEDDVIREAIRKELSREGQVYFVHNRVQTIAGCARRLKKLVPEARIAIAHGQMSDDDLEAIMLDFYAGDYDVLCCTSIIESGLDVPNVNTLIVQNSTGFGLAQLYQLRGRVGRSSRQAFAYLLYSDPARMTPDGEERLAAIKEFSELGSGLRIAMRDLEIRGAGNLLGGEQHGHIEAVGFELYCQMLQEAVAQLRDGEMPRREASELPAVDLPIDAFLPASYVPAEGQRLDVYRRLSTVRDLERLADIEQEIVDRFGPMPDEAANLIRVLRFRVLCSQRGVVASPIEAGSFQLRIRTDRVITKGSDARLRKYWIQHSRRILRALVVKELWVTVTFANTTPEAKLSALEEIVQLIETEKRQTRSAL